MEKMFSQMNEKEKVDFLYKILTTENLTLFGGFENDCETKSI